MIITNTLSPELTQQLQLLLDECEAFDHASTNVQLDIRINLNKDMPCYLIALDDEKPVAVCSIMAINAFEGEISIAVSPKKRNQGLATTLKCKAKQILSEYDYNQILYVNNDDSVSGKKYIDHLNIPFHHTEYTLIFDKSHLPSRATRLLVSRASERDLHQITTISVDAFGDEYEIAYPYVESSFQNPSRTVYMGQLNYEPICCLIVGFENETYSINAVAVLKSHQGKGYGKEFIQEVIYNLVRNQHDILIDVDNTNLNAYHLYKKIGFKEQSVTNYYVEML
ncbi:GNAT family N-acetyltransferase [Fusibacter bizertensis]